MSSERATRASSQEGATSRFQGFQVGSDTQWWYELKPVRLVGVVRERGGGVRARG